MAQDEDDIKRILIRNTREFDSVILINVGAGLEGFGIDHDDCYRIGVQIDLGIGGKKALIENVNKTPEPDRDIQASVKKLKFSSVIGFNTDSINREACDCPIADAHMDVIYVIKGHKYYSRNCYASGFCADYCPTRDRRQFSEIYERLRRYYKGANF
jgi:hypothetical protein